jgi:hypothetical protein
MIGKRAKVIKVPPTDLACWDKFFAAKPLIPARFARFSQIIRLGDLSLSCILAEGMLKKFP